MLAAAAGSEEPTRSADKEPARPVDKEPVRPANKNPRPLGTATTAAKFNSAARFLNLRPWRLHFGRGDSGQKPGILSNCIEYEKKWCWKTIVKVGNGTGLYAWFSQHLNSQRNQTSSKFLPNYRCQFTETVARVNLSTHLAILPATLRQQLESRCAEAWAAE